jgi:hypothetical protein
MPPAISASKRALSVVGTVAALALIIALGVVLRWWICSTLETVMKPPGAEELPYTLESALLFHYAEHYQQTGRFPHVDERAEVPEGLHVARDLSVGKEVVAAWLYNGLGLHGMSFQRFVRRFDAAWYCLGLVPLFFLVRGRTRSTLAASLAALLLAGAYTAVVRSTGLEFSRENFALPFIFAHVWLLDVGLRTRRLAPSDVAGVLLAVALATWDLTQLYLLLVVAYWVARCLVRRAAAERLVHLAPTIGAAFVAGLVVPYLWAHRFVVSYAMLLGYGLMAWWLLQARIRLSGPAAKAALAVVAAATLMAAWALPAGKTYGHFRELFFAKLRYLNVKPEDPKRLSYDARILWTPALHSATAEFMGRRPIGDFRAMFVLGLIAAGCVAAAKLRRRAIGDVSFFAAMLLAWFVLYVLFVRMQVFLIFFIAAFVGLGLGAAGALAGRRWPVAVGAPVVVLFLIADLGRGIFFGKVDERYKLYVPESQYALYENAQLNKLVWAYGRSFNYAGAAKLVEWLRANTPEDAVVLADFTLEPTILEYAGRPIVLHPKFESPAMRDKVHAFFEAFFAPSEQDFHDFCLRTGTDYFVLNPGMFGGPTSRGWLYSPRYIAAVTSDNLDAIGTSWMYKEPDKCGYFRHCTDIGARGELLPVYRVFKVVTQDEIREAARFTSDGAGFLENYMEFKETEDLELAAEALEQAVALWPGCAEAYRLMESVYALLGNEDRAAQARAAWRRLERGQP